MSTNRNAYGSLAALAGVGLPGVSTTVPITNSGTLLTGWESAGATTQPLSLGALAALYAPATPYLQSSALTIPAPSLVPVVQSPIIPWAFVRERFNQLIDRIGISAEEAADGMKKAKRVVGSLNRAYYGHSSETDNGYLVGSWAKQTRVRPFSDIDVLFVLPWSEYWRFETHISNKQSNLLQDVRKNLLVTYPRTEIWGDRHVVTVEVDGTLIEVVPAFALANGQYWVCDTKENGRYKVADPAAEERALESAVAPNENARQLTRLLKKWQLHNDVRIKSFQLERLAIEFMAQWHCRLHDRFWYDWMVRDFFAYMIDRANGWVQMPGTGEWIELGSDWLSDAKSAGFNAAVACIHEQNNYGSLAGDAWTEVFGNTAQVSMS
jgi:hypothetical protein